MKTRLAVLVLACGLGVVPGVRAQAPMTAQTIARGIRNALILADQAPSAASLENRDLNDALFAEGYLLGVMDGLCNTAPVFSCSKAYTVESLGRSYLKYLDLHPERLGEIAAGVCGDAWISTGILTVQTPTSFIPDNKGASK